MLKRAQQGMSFWAILVLAPMVGLTVLTGIKLVPVYIEDAAVKEVLTTMSRDPEGYATPNELRGSFTKRIEVNDVKIIAADDLSIERDGSFYDVTADFEARVSLFYNISLLVSFSHQAKVPAR